MLMQTFTIHSTLPTLADRGDEDWIVETQNLIDEAISEANLSRMKPPVEMCICYYEPNMRRDKDKVFQSSVFILAGLIQAGVIKNAYAQNLRPVMSKYRVSKKDPRVEVEMWEVDDE